MSTSIRPEVTRKNKYWISKHRFYELKHFCLQYPEFVDHYNALDGYSKKSLNDISENIDYANRTLEKCVIKRDLYAARIKIIEQCAKSLDPVLGNYIFKAVTQDLSYQTLKTKYNIPCGKDIYYGLYRKFFWLLSGVRDQLLV